MWAFQTNYLIILRRIIVTWPHAEYLTHRVIFALRRTRLFFSRTDIRLSLSYKLSHYATLELLIVTRNVNIVILSLHYCDNRTSYPKVYT